MSDGIMITIGDDGEATLYDDTYDITIHCESKEEQDEVKRVLQNVPHWIPVTERLPETYESVLVWSNGYICKDMIVCPYDDKIWYRCGKIEDDDYWMPLSCLPEPYKGVTT